MKKLAIVLFASMLFVLGACSSNNDDNSSTNADDNANTEENQDQNANDNASDDVVNNNTDDETNNEEENNADDQATNNAENEEDTATDSELADYPEYDTLVDEIDVDSLQAEVETDNPNKRVILYSDDSGEKVFKSIFIKKKDRLKIIDFDDDGEIFNEVIK